MILNNFMHFVLYEVCENEDDKQYVKGVWLRSAAAQCSLIHSSERPDKIKGLGLVFNNERGRIRNLYGENSDIELAYLLEVLDACY